MKDVVSIRIDKADRVRLHKIAESEYRTFQEQCRLALHEWLHNEDGHKQNHKDDR